MKLKFILSALIIFLILATKAQQSLLGVQAFPLSFIDFVSGSAYKLGLETKVYKNWSIRASAGGYFSNFNGLTNTKGALINMELKRYFKDNSGRYFSLDGLVKNQSFTWSSDTIRIAPDHIQSYRLDKHLWAISLKYGKNTVYPSGFTFDWFVGLGLRYKNVSTDLTAEEIKHRDPGDSQIVPFMTSVGHRVVPNFIAGFTVGYSISRLAN